MNKKRVMILPADVAACGYYRAISPYRQIKELNLSNNIHFDIFDVHNKKNISMRELVSYDAVMFQRPTYSEHIVAIKELNKRGIKTVIEIDDLLTAVHPENYAYKVFYKNSPSVKNFIDCLKEVHVVHTSTPELAYHLKPYVQQDKQFHVFLNSIDLGDVRYKEEPLNKKNNKTINIMWAGSSSHKDSLGVIRGVVEPVINKNENAKLVICGNKEFSDLFDLAPNKKEFIPGVQMEDYYKIPSMADIFLAPLVPSSFNDSKSELKILEAAVWSIPTIATPVEPYKRFHDVSNGGCVLAKKNRPDSWQKQLQLLIDDENHRISIGNLARKAVEDNYNLINTNKKRVEFWEDFLL